MACRYASVAVQLERLLQSHTRSCRPSGHRQYSTQVNILHGHNITILVATFDYIGVDFNVHFLTNAKSTFQQVACTCFLQEF